MVGSPFVKNLNTKIFIDNLPYFNYHGLERPIVVNIIPITRFSIQGQREKHSYKFAPNFEGTPRVDKGLLRFCEVNENRMPITLQEFIFGLKPEMKISPIEAMKKAFEFLNISETVNDIKSVFSKEPLFANLKNPHETKASIGLLRLIKEDSELLELGGEGVLKDKTNLTVYLVKKIFLENKTLKEINEDLENDLNEDLKAEYKFKYPKADYVHRSTLAALGIKGLNPEFRTSLRYTKEGYSDLQGEKVSAGLQNFWESLSPEERTAKAKKSVERFEIWWNSHSKNEILEMIAAQTTELDMLKSFKAHLRNEEKLKNKETATISKEIVMPSSKTHAKVGSEKLKSDELFIKWATNNLKLYIANLSEADKDSLHIKRMQLLVTRWAEMTPNERTEYISKMKSGLEPLRFTMIDAWNNCKEIIKDLYTFLKTNQIYKPSEFLYSPEEFSKTQSDVMTAFWQKFPQHAKTLGLSIVASNQAINLALSRGTFEELKNQILRDKKDRVKEFEKIKFIQAPKIDSTIQNELSEYAQIFFECKGENTYDELVELLAQLDIYDLRKLFSEKSPAKAEEKEKIYDKLKKDLLPQIKDKYDCVFEYTEKPFEQEKYINQYCLQLGRDMKLLPRSFVERYLKETKILHRKNAVLRSENPAKVPFKKNYISNELKISIAAMEIALGKILYQATRDTSFAQYSLSDNNMMLRNILSDWNKAVPRRLMYNINDESKCCMLYSKPNLQKLQVMYFSILNELRTYCSADFTPTEEEDINIGVKLVERLSLDPSKKELNRIILDKLEFIQADVSLMDNTLILQDMTKRIFENANNPDNAIKKIKYY